MKIKNKNLFKTLIAFISLFFLLFLTNIRTYADTISDLTKEWSGSVSSNGVINRGSYYASLPESIKKVIKQPKIFSKYNQNTGYPVGQCTWYVWNRAQEFGIEYDQFEGNGGEWGKRGTGSNRIDKVLPHVALSTTAFGSSAQYGHVMFVEYVDNQGNILISEGNVAQYYNKSNSQATFMIITASTVKANMANGTLNFVEPKNKSSIANYGKNPDGSEGGTGTDSEESKDEKTEEKEETQSKYFGVDAWKNKMVNFQNNAYQSTFRGIQTGSTGFINNALVLGINNASNTAIKYAYVAMLYITSALILYMFFMIILYMVVLPNGLGGYKALELFEKGTGVSAYGDRKKTLPVLFGRLGLALILMTCLYANLIPMAISGIVSLIRLIIGVF